MAQYLGYLGHRGSVAEHLGSERMTKQVRSSVGWANSSASKSTLHHYVDGCGVGETLVGSRADRMKTFRQVHGGLSCFR
jgi:hypothetical protein